MLSVLAYLWLWFQLWSSIAVTVALVVDASMVVAAVYTVVYRAPSATGDPAAEQPGRFLCVRQGDTSKLFGLGSTPPVLTN